MEKPKMKDFGYIESNSFEEESYWAFEEGEDRYLKAIAEWESKKNIQEEKKYTEEDMANAFIAGWKSDTDLSYTTFPEWLKLHSSKK